jgi:hypothetical protein
MYSPNRQRTYDEDGTPRSEAHNRLSHFANNYGRMDSATPKSIDDNPRFFTQ